MQLSGAEPAASVVWSALQAVGYELHRYRHHRWHLIGVEGQPATLIDVGCAIGTPEFYAPFPDAALFLVDPLVEHEPRMRELAGGRPAGGSYAITAVGAALGALEFNIALDLPMRSSFFGRTALTGRQSRIERRKVPATTLNELAAKHNLTRPDGLKIGTEGFELEMIRGARATLRDTLFVVAETPVQRRFKDSY